MTGSFIDQMVRTALMSWDPLFLVCVLLYLYMLSFTSCQPDNLTGPLSLVGRHCADYHDHAYFTIKGETAFKNQYMKREGIPFFVWYMGFKPGVTAFMKKFRNHVTALEQRGSKKN